jgi:hypothetical protein
MSTDPEMATFEEFKRWVLSRDPMRCEIPMRDQITLALQDLGFEHIRVNQVIHHPVWNVSARVGQFQADNLRSLKVALKKMCGELGFRTRMSEIVASLNHGRVSAAFLLAPPNHVPAEVEDDGHRVPEHLEFEDAA